MEFRTLIFFCMVIISCLLVCNAFPRDSSLVKQETVSDVNNVGTKENLSPTVIVERGYKIGRVKCQYEEPTEDIVCQEHCLPKGYSFGICVSNTCSCV